MQSQERELITGLFGRLQPFESQTREGEAEALIKDFVSRQPASPYLLVQAVLVQEQALKAAQERIAELEQRNGTAAAAPSGFLGSAPKLGPWGSQQPQAAAPRASVPSTRSPLQAAVAPQAAGGGGSFLRTAMATAAGVAGGALLFEGIRNMMGSNPGPFGQAASAQPASQADQQQALADSGAGNNSGNEANNDPGNDPMPDDMRNDDYDTAAYDNDMGGSDEDYT